MKNIFKITILSFNTIMLMECYSVAQQYYNNVPQINNIYTNKMMRTTEIPSYGKNKHLYFFNAPKREEHDFHDSGLYLFTSYGMGNTTTGINADNGIYDSDDNYLGGSDANNTMGTAASYSFGVGREMSKDLNVEFFYSHHTGLSYGKFALFNEEADEENEDEEKKSTDKKQVNKSRKVNGGNILLQFAGAGFKYNLDQYTGTFGGKLKPYVGVQLGISKNTINDYTITDPEGYPDGESDPAPEDWDAKDYPELGQSDMKTYEHIQYENGEITHIGSTNNTFALNLETGLSVLLEGNLQLDLFYKVNKLGKITTSGKVIKNYDVTTTQYYVPSEDNPSGCKKGGTYTMKEVGEEQKPFCMFEPETDEDVQSITNDHTESGSATFNQYGIKLRYLF